MKQRKPETARENSLRAWRKKFGNDKEAWNAKVRAYRAKRKNEGNPIVRQIPTDKLRKSGRFKRWQREEVRARYGSLCMYCLAPAPTVDHVVPLALGGGDEFENLVPACWSCNSSKQDRPLLMWMAIRGGYLYRNKIC